MKSNFLKSVGARLGVALKPLVIPVTFQVGGGLVTFLIWGISISQIPFWRWMLGWCVLVYCIGKTFNRPDRDNGAAPSADPRQGVTSDAVAGSALAEPGSGHTATTQPS